MEDMQTVGVTEEGSGEMVADDPLWPPEDDQPKKKHVKDFLLEYLPCKHKYVLYFLN